ncbi:unannotated protein [freshwater metagenome]|uniref:Unannotated protein n=1 Tax=freshwater metagenome TaxID=449393 RepID=A0A6J6B4Z2_9ZZZZ
MGGHTAIAAIKTAVPTVGNKALYPGNAVLSEKAKTERTKRKAPAQTNKEEFADLREKKLFGTKRRSAPIPNSQARVGSE